MCGLYAVCYIFFICPPWGNETATRSTHTHPRSTQPNEMTGEKRIVKNKRERKTIYTKIKERTGERERDTI